jgi:Xaa-Pro aminopeptidase
LVAPCPLLHELRLRKSPEELEQMRLAARISAEAHELARQVARPGLNERQVQAVIEQHFLEQGARGPAYGSIVAGGDNACVLHYTANNSELKDGDLLLIDAGCSVNDYYNGDITRTFPINGRFSGEQRALYELVLAAQEAAVAAVGPGATAEGVHGTAVGVLVDGLVELGLLKGERDGLIETIVRQSAQKVAQAVVSPVPPSFANLDSHWFLVKVVADADEVLCAKLIEAQ